MSGFPQLASPKLLGVPIIPDSTGASQYDAVSALLNDWDVKDEVIALVFDTTASNTGRIKGCATWIEKYLLRAVLWFACRHHVFEIHIQHVAEEIIGKRNTPSEAIFKRFQKDFPGMDQDTAVSLIKQKYKRIYDKIFN